MRTAGTLELCAAIYPSLEWHARLYLSAVFENPSMPEFEPTLTKLFENEDADDLRVRFATALALLGTPSSQEKARAVYEEFPEDPERFCVAEVLYYQFAIQGIDDPMMEKWRARMNRFREIDADPSRFFSKLLDETLAPRPIVSEHPKIGRNDPCPCGSGKKYKKCCLHS